VDCKFAAKVLGGRTMERRRKHCGELVAAGLLALSVSGCGLSVPDNSDDQIAQRAVDELKRGDLVALDAISGPEMKTPEARANLAPIQAFFPKGEARSVTRQAWRANANIGQPPMLTLDEAYDYPDRTLVAEVTMSQDGAPHRWIIRGIHINSTMKAPAAPASKASAAS
jgi:hypothetical protein